METYNRVADAMSKRSSAATELQQKRKGELNAKIDAMNAEDAKRV